MSFSNAAFDDHTFRMSLNVSSTRNILLNGYAGNVVETFGQFVGGGNLVVGMVIFFILIIIQFIVINKGSRTCI